MGPPPCIDVDPRTLSPNAGGYRRAPHADVTVQRLGSLRPLGVGPTRQAGAAPAMAPEVTGAGLCHIRAGWRFMAGKPTTGECDRWTRLTGWHCASRSSQ